MRIVPCIQNVVVVGMWAFDWGESALIASIHLHGHDVVLVFCNLACVLMIRSLALLARDAGVRV